MEALRAQSACMWSFSGVNLGFFRVFSKVCIKTAPSASFPSRPLWRAPVLRFLAFGGKIEQGSCWWMYQDESWAPNARKRSTGALHRSRNAGKRSTGAVLRASNFWKNSLVLQKIAFEKISSSRDAFFKTGRWGKSTFFWVRNSVPWPEIVAKMGFAFFGFETPFWRACAISGHGTEFLTQK